MASGSASGDEYHPKNGWTNRFRRDEHHQLRKDPTGYSVGRGKRPNRRSHNSFAFQPGVLPSFRLTALVERSSAPCKTWKETTGNRASHYTLASHQPVSLVHSVATLPVNQVGRYDDAFEQETDCLPRSRPLPRFGRHRSRNLHRYHWHAGQ